MCDKRKKIEGTSDDEEKEDKASLPDICSSEEDEGLIDKGLIDQSEHDPEFYNLVRRTVNLAKKYNLLRGLVLTRNIGAIGKCSLLERLEKYKFGETQTTENNADFLKDPMFVAKYDYKGLMASVPELRETNFSELFSSFFNIFFHFHIYVTLKPNDYNYKNTPTLYINHILSCSYSLIIKYLCYNNNIVSFIFIRI